MTVGEPGFAPVDRSTVTRSRTLIFLLALAGSATLAACGAARMSMEVPLTLGERMEPEATIAPREGVATLVIAYPGPDQGTSQAVTLVSHSGEFLGQLAPRSYLVTSVPAGELGVYAGRPELTYPEWCHGMQGSVAAGKMYVLLVGSMFGVSSVGAADPGRLAADQLARELAPLTRLRPAPARGRAATEAALEDFWKPCIKRQDEEGAREAKTGFARLQAAKSSTHLHAEWGYGPLTLSPPR
jgi:hypothetical protein